MGKWDVDEWAMFALSVGLVVLMIGAAVSVIIEALNG